MTAGLLLHTELTDVKDMIESMRFCPFRKEKHGYQRYTSKMYVEHTLFQSASWQRHIILARSLPPLVSYTYTDAELKLFRFIVEWHLASVQFKTIPASDCLIRFEELLNFYQTLRQFRENISSTSIAPQESAVPPKLSRRSSPDLQKRVDSSSCNALLPARIPLVAPSHPIPPQPRSTPDKKQSGWIQINNIFLPYIVKNSTAQHEQNIRDREYYIPYEILVKCHILSTNEYPWKNTLIKASQTDFDLLNHLITDINIFDEKVPEKTLLVNLYHIMVGIERLFYVKFLPNKQPRTQVNKYHSEVLKLQGGTLMIRANQLVPYILQNNRFYVPLYYTCESMPTLLIQARRSARAPRQYEVDYLNLILLYFSIETSPFTSDTLLVDIFNIKCSSLPSSIHFRTLQEQQQFEKKRLFTSIPPTPKASKSAGENDVLSMSISSDVFLAGSSTHKSPKQPLGQVMINPLIHHPSFYGLTSPALPPPIQPMRAPSAGSTSRSTDRDAHSSTSALKSSAAPEIKTVMFHQHSFSGIVRSPDLPVHRWKISLKQMCKRLSPSIEYEKFLQWCQTNSLVPLLRLDEDERKVVQVNDSDDFYIYHEHFDRCLDLLNDLQHGSIGMTLLPSSSSLPADKISFAGNANTTADAEQSLVSRVRVLCRCEETQKPFVVNNTPQSNRKHRRSRPSIGEGHFSRIAVASSGDFIYGGRFLHRVLYRGRWQDACGGDSWRRTVDRWGRSSNGRFEINRRWNERRRRGENTIRWHDLKRLFLWLRVCTCCHSQGSGHSWSDCWCSHPTWRTSGQSTGQTARENSIEQEPSSVAFIDITKR